MHALQQPGNHGRKFSHTGITIDRSDHEMFLKEAGILKHKEDSMIHSYQHVAIGVSDIHKSYQFYHDHLGFRFKMIDVKERYPEIELDKSYSEEEMRTGNERELSVIISFHPQGGAGIQLIQQNPPTVQKKRMKYGDKGFFELGMVVTNLPELYKRMEKSIEFETPIISQHGPGGQKCDVAYLRDPDGVLIQFIQRNSTTKKKRKPPRTIGMHHIGIGVTDIGKARNFYGSVLGFDK